MFVENLEDLPETLRADFIESEFNGKKGFQHKDTVALVNSLKNAKSEREDIRGKFGELETRLNGYEEQKKADIQAARDEALEQARSKGDVSAIEERYKQQMADLETRKDNDIKRLTGELESVTVRVKTEKKAAVVSDLAEFATSEGSPAFKALLKSRTDIADDGSIIYLDENGGATSLDKDGFISQLRSEPMFKPLMQSSVVTSSAGNVNGSGRGSVAARTAKRAEFDEWDQVKRKSFFADGGKLIN